MDLGVTSTCAAVGHGIPEGSGLSPFLFNIYTDSLQSKVICGRLENLTFPILSTNYSPEAREEALQRRSMVL